MNGLNKLFSISLWAVMVAVFIAVCFGGDYLVRNHLILPGFSALEKREANIDVGRCVDAIHREIYHMEKLGGDWARWDDMYQYVQDGNEAFSQSNFKWESLESSGIDLIYILNNEHKIIWSGIHDPRSNEMVTLEEFPAGSFPANHVLITGKSGIDKKKGIVFTGRGPIFISSQTILTSAEEGPSRGCVIMGRFLTEGVIKDLSRQTRINFSIKDPLISGFSSKEKELLTDLSRGKNVFETIDEDKLEAYGMIADMGGTQALLVTTILNRDIMKQGKVTAGFASIAILASLAVISLSLLIWFVLFRHKSRRLNREISLLVEQRTAELSESEERLRTLINAVPDIICFKDGEGRWLEANEADLLLFQLNNVDYRGKKDSELANSTHPCFRDAFLGCEQTDEKAWRKGVISSQEEVIPTPDGQIKTLDVIKVPLFHANGSRKGLIVLGRDLTEARKLQAKLQKAEKMEAIGMLAGGVAHDLNNILSGIINYPELLLLKLPETSELRKPLEAIHNSGIRASEIVADLLTVARGVTVAREPANINTLIREYCDSPEYRKLETRHPDVRIITELDPEVLNISCSPVHIRKCLMNLITNAAESIKGRGTVVVSSRNAYVDRSFAGDEDMKKGEYVVVTVADNGKGIEKENLDHIFEPFYTKKKMGMSGTGLGLTVVWNAVKDHEGRITVESGDQGTSFTIYFPAIREEVATSSEKIALDDLAGHGEHVLVVDDERQQLDIAARMLGLLGYTVTCANSGEEAIAYLRDHSVELLILDMIMDPGINGRTTYEKIIQIHPGQKAIITSGFSDSEDVKQSQALGVGLFIKKPYLLRQLGQAVKQALAQ
jgi:PAS domain S-box-containing protein